MKFKLPDTLPATVDELDALLDTAQKDINVIQARAEAGEDLTSDDVDALNELSDAVESITSAKTAAIAEEANHTAKVAEALTRAKTVIAPPENTPDEAAGEVIAEAESIVEESSTVSAATAVPVTFAGAGVTDASVPVSGPAWLMSQGAPGYRPGKVGFKELGEAIDSVTKGHGVGRRNKPARGEYARQSLATLSRELTVVDDSHELVKEIERATSFLPNGQRVTAESLTAAGGWCAPSEQLYDFCDVPDATDLISLPEIAIRRGGIRWPVEPDLSAIFDSFEFFFTEPELEAVDSGDGTPTAFKHCVEIPCPDEFVELRLNAVGYCVEAGILQRQGWPESIEWFLRSLTQEHLRAMSRRTILDMVSGSGAAKVFPSTIGVGGTSSVLNAIALMATNLRLNKGLSRGATIEGVAPSWLHEALRADLAMTEDKAYAAVSDGQISSWLTARNISLQYVGDWQTRSAGLPGHLSTYVWPSTVDVLLYPAGTWFRSMQNIIEVGVMYPKEQLQVNRYTEFFTEDAYAVGKRCNVSSLVTIPLCINGAYGAPVEIVCDDSSV